MTAPRRYCATPGCENVLPPDAAKRRYCQACVERAKVEAAHDLWWWELVAGSRWAQATLQREAEQARRARAARVADRLGLERRKVLEVLAEVGA